MKRTLIAAAFAALASPALALEIAPPFEQNEFDRTLPQLNLPAPRAALTNEARLPYDQLAIDRALPQLPQTRVRVAQAELDGLTRVDAGMDVGNGAAAPAASAWANDWNFIAPPQ